MGRAVALLALLAGLPTTGLPTVRAAAQECDVPPPEVTDVRRDGRVEILVLPRGAGDVAVAIDARIVGMRADRRLPHAATFRPGLRTPALVLTPEPHREWRFEYTYRWVPGRVDAVHDDAYRYLLPFPDGASPRMIQGPGGAFSHGGKQAWDWAMPEGTPVLAAREGVVVATCDRHTTGGPDPALADSANYVHVQHPDGTIGRYVHLMPAGVRVVPGQWVARGQLLGLSGNTGFSAGPHLHFEVVRLGPDLAVETVPARFERELQ